MLKPTYKTSEVEMFAESLGVDLKRLLKPGITFEESKLFPQWLESFSRRVQQLWVVSESELIESSPSNFLVIDLCLN